MRQAFDVAYHYALTNKRGGAVPIIAHQSVADVLADAKGRIEAVRLLAWRALDAVIAQDPAGPELALHAKIFGSETGVEVITRLMNVVGVQAYDSSFPLMAYPVRGPGLPGHRGRQYRLPPPPAPGPAPRTRIQPAQRLWNGLSGGFAAPSLAPAINRAEHPTSTYQAEGGQEPGPTSDLIPPGDDQQAELTSGPPRRHSASRPAARRELDHPGRPGRQRVLPGRMTHRPDGTQ